MNARGYNFAKPVQSAATLANMVSHQRWMDPH